MTITCPPTSHTHTPYLPSLSFCFHPLARLSIFSLHSASRYYCQSVQPQIIILCGITALDQLLLINCSSSFFVCMHSFFIQDRIIPLSFGHRWQMTKTKRCSQLRPWKKGSKEEGERKKRWRKQTKNQNKNHTAPTNDLEKQQWWTTDRCAAKCSVLLLVVIVVVVFIVFFYFVLFICCLLVCGFWSVDWLPGWPRLWWRNKTPMGNKQAATWLTDEERK